MSAAARGAAIVALGVVLPLRDETSQRSVGLTHSWQLVDGAHWQILAEEPIELASETDTTEGTRGDCGEGMVAVSGRMKEGYDIEQLQDVTCTRWLSRAYPARCATYDRVAWLRASKSLVSHALRFCIDRFEYPNLKNAYPIIEVTWHESEAICKAEGKRLCSEAEWTFACEGEEATPYPTGYARDPHACVIDRPWRRVDEAELVPRDGHAALVEIDRLWQGEASGSNPRCKSIFGVYDLTGNIDEWTTSVEPGEASILKGGYWGPDRARCRPSTRAHGEDFSFYQQGFRCCQNLN